MNNGISMILANWHFVYFRLCLKQNVTSKFAPKVNLFLFSAVVKGNISLSIYHLFFIIASFGAR